MAAVGSKMDFKRIFRAAVAVMMFLFALIYVFQGIMLKSNDVGETLQRFIEVNGWHVETIPAGNGLETPTDAIVGTAAGAPATAGSADIRIPYQVGYEYMRDLLHYNTLIYIGYGVLWAAGALLMCFHKRVPAIIAAILLEGVSILFLMYGQVLSASLNASGGGLAFVLIGGGVSIPNVLAVVTAVAASYASYVDPGPKREDPMDTPRMPNGRREKIIRGHL